MTALSYKNKNIQRLRRLVRQKSQRDAEGVFVVEGSKILAEAVDAGATVEAVFVTAGYSDALIEQLQASGTEVHHLEPGVVAKVADTVSPQPVLATVATFATELEDLLGSAQSLMVLADVRDPGNAGTVVRSAEAAGLDGVIFCAGSVDVFSPKTVRSSAGALFHVPVAVAADTTVTLPMLTNAGFKVMGTTMTGGIDYDEADLTGRAAIVLGNEANGLGSEKELINQWLSIPISGRSESLNVSMAASILAFEVARQRRNRG